MAQLESDHYISETMDNFTDARVLQWPLVSSPLLIPFISFAYLYLVYFAGPQFMKNRKPYSLVTFIQCYNLFQIIVNFWLVFEVMTYGKPFTAVWRYCDFDKIYDHGGEKQLELLWWTLLLKIIDFSETIVFVLRKKDRQISFLHTYHHVSTVIYMWLFLRYVSHTFIMTMLVLNCSVHVIMYSYYFLTTFGSSMQQKLLPYKKWLTLIQMSHIGLMVLISIQGLIPTCGNMTVKYFSVLTIFNCTVNLLFFSNFYFFNNKLKTV